MNLEEKIEEIIYKNETAWGIDVAETIKEICALLKEMGINPKTELTGKLDLANNK